MTPFAFRNTPDAWGSVAKLFHWLSALLILFLIGDGWWMTHLVARAGQLQQYQLHATVGYYLLLLLTLRLLWRVGNPVPAAPQDVPRWERLTARAVHWSLYVLTFAVATSGWLLAGTLSRPLGATLFGFIDVPNLLDASRRAMHETLEETHRVSSYALFALAGFHLFSALASSLLVREQRAAAHVVGQVTG
jgi:cytochrome b561